MKHLFEYLSTKLHWNKEEIFANMDFNIEIKDSLDKEYSKEDIKKAMGNWRDKEFINKLKKIDINLHICKDSSMTIAVDKIFLDMYINNDSHNINSPNSVPDIRCKYSMEDKHLTGFQSMGVKIFGDKLWSVGENGEDPIIETIKNLEKYIELR